MRQMVNTAIGEIRDQVLLAARRAGFRHAERWLSRWHRAGVIPRPERRFVGRPWGSISVYPRGTTKLFLAACAMHAREPRLPLRNLLWRRWWEGYDVLTPQIRSFLGQIAKGWEQRIAGLVKNGELTHAGRIFVREASNGRTTFKLIGGMRKRVGRRKFAAFLRLTLELLSGEFYYISDEQDLRFIEQSLGRTAKAQPLRPVRQDPPGSIREPFARFHPSVFKERLNAASDEDLKRARNETRTFLEAIGRLGVVSSSRRTPLLRRFQEMLDDAPVLSQVVFVLVWLVRSDKQRFTNALDSLRWLGKHPTHPAIRRVFGPIYLTPPSATYPQ